MKRRVLAVLLAGTLAFSNIGAVIAAETSAGGNAAAEMTAAEEEPAEEEESETSEIEFELSDGTEESVGIEDTQDKDGAPEDDSEETFAEAGETGTEAIAEESEESGDPADDAGVPVQEESVQEEAAEEDPAVPEADKDETDAAPQAEGPEQDEEAVIEETAGEEESREARSDADEGYAVFTQSDGYMSAFPGGEIEIRADGHHWYYDENGEYHEDMDGLTYYWTIEDEGAGYASIVPHKDDPSKATLKFKKYSGQIRMLIWVDVCLTSESGEQMSENCRTGFWMSTDYVDVVPMDLDRYLEIGDSMENVEFEARRYICGVDGYQVLDDVTDVVYRWDYDENAVSITEMRNGKPVEIGNGGTGNGNTFTITRKREWATDYHVHALWTNENREDQDNWNNYLFEHKNYDIWFDEHDQDVYTDAGSAPVNILETGNLGDNWRDRFDLDIQVGEWDGDNEEWGRMLAGTEYKMTNEEGRVRLSLAMSYLSSLEDDYKDVRLVASLYPKGAEKTPENRIRDTDAWFHINKAREDYDKEKDRTMLTGWDGSVSGSYGVFIQNSEYPDGRDDRYNVTDVQVVRDEPWEGEGGKVIVDFHRDQNSDDDYWWYYRVGHRGKATLKVTYTDLDGKTQSYEFTLSVGNHTYRVYMDSEGRVRNAFPGGEIELYADASHEYYGEDGEYNNDNFGLGYEWFFKRGERYAEIEVHKDDPSRATLKFKEIPDGWDWIDQHIQVGVRILDADGNETEGYDSTNFWVRSDYTEVWPLELDREMDLGARIDDQKFEVRRYEYGKDGYEVIDKKFDVTYEWHYDQNVLSITEKRSKKTVEVGDGEPASGNTFTFTRKGDWNSDFSVRAYWEEDNEGRDVWGNYQLWNRNYDFWYEINENDTIYSDGKRTFGFNLDNLQGVEFTLVPEVGNGEWVEGKGFTEPIAEGNGWTFDDRNNLITFDGEALYAAGIDHFETRISLQIGGVEVRDEWRGFNVQEIQEDFWDLHDEVLFVGEERFISKYGRAYVRNTLIPDGMEVNYTITKLEFESDEDPFDTRDAVEITEVEDGWVYRAIRGGDEQIRVKIHVDNGIEIRGTVEYDTEASFRLIVGGRRFNIGLETETGSDRLQSGKEIRLTPVVHGEEYEWDTGDRHEIDLSGYEVRYEVNCWHVADRLIEDRYDGDWEAATARGELWDYTVGKDDSIVVKSLDEDSYEVEVEVRAMLIDPDSGDECASASRSIFIDRVILELRLLDEKGKVFDWNGEIPPGAEVKLTPQLMRNALDGDYTPVQDHTDVTYRLDWYEGSDDEYDRSHVEVTDRNGNKIHPGDELEEADCPVTIKRLVDWDFNISLHANWNDDEGWEQGIDKDLVCTRKGYSDGFTWNSSRGDGGYTWYYTSETINIVPDRAQLDALKKQGYDVKTTVEIGLFDGEKIYPITNYKIDENGRRGEAQGEYVPGGFSEQKGLQISGSKLEDLYQVLRYQNDVWGSQWGRINLKIHSELNGVVLVDRVLRVTICHPYLEISGFRSEMGVGQEQVWENGQAELYLEDVDHDSGDYYEAGDYFDIVIDRIELKDAQDAQYIKAEKDGSDVKITALKESVKRVPLTIHFTGGPNGYTSCDAEVTVKKGVFDYELRNGAGEKTDVFDMIVGEKDKLVPYVTYTEGGKTTAVPAKKGGQYYFQTEYNYYDERVIDVDGSTGEFTALTGGSTELDVVIRVFDKNGNQVDEKWPFATVNVSVCRAELSLPDDAVLKVRPGQSLTAQQVMDALKPGFAVYSMRKPEGEKFEIGYSGLEEVIGRKDELVLSNGENGDFKKLTVSKNAKEGEAILIIFAVGGYGNRASAGVKVVIESDKKEQALACDTSTPAVVNKKTIEYTVSGAKGALTCTVADPSVAKATVSGNKIKVEGLKAGDTKLIVKAAETDEYAAAEKEFDLHVITLGKTRRGDMFNLAGTVKVTWEAVPGAIWYKVYRSGKKDPVIVTKALIGYDNTEGMTPGEKYTYTIVASTTGKDANGKIVSGGESPVSYSKVMYRLKTVAWKYVKNTAPGKVLASYQKSPYGDSYVLLYADNEAMVGAKSKVIFGANTTACTLGGFKKGKTYWFQIRVRKKVNGIDYYTTFGAKKKVVITK